MAPALPHVQKSPVRVPWFIFSDLRGSLEESTRTSKTALVPATSCTTVGGSSVATHSTKFLSGSSVATCSTKVSFESKRSYETQFDWKSNMGSSVATSIISVGGSSVATQGGASRSQKREGLQRCHVLNIGRAGAAHPRGRQLRERVPLGRRLPAADQVLLQRLRTLLHGARRRRRRARRHPSAGAAAAAVAGAHATHPASGNAAAHRRRRDARLGRGGLRRPSALPGPRRSRAQHLLAPRQRRGERRNPF